MRSMSLQSGEVGRLLAIQCVLTSAVVAYFLVTGDPVAAQAAAYGGAMALLIAWMLGRRALLAAEVAKTHPGGEMMVIYTGAVQRFVAVIVLFGLGMGWLDLQPVPLLAAFAIAQLGHVLNSAFVRVRDDGRRMERLG